MANRFYYGGQAVVEGVMIRGQKAVVTTVRRPGGGLATDIRPLPNIYAGWMRQSLLPNRFLKFLISDSNITSQQRARWRILFI